MAAEAFATTELDELCVAVDARRREGYWAAYSRAGGRTTGPWVMRPSEIASTYRQRAWVGPAEHASDLVVQVTAYPRAAWVGRTVAALFAEGAVAVAPSLELAEHGADGGSTAAALVGHALLSPEPLYLRRPDAAVPVVRS
jgi:tRNA threonylcarbamoyladenosine biosynthesis protein TsaB